MAVYPSPDNVVPVQEKVDQALDRCFIGACTTTTVDLILASLVLRQGLRSGLKPATEGIRRVTPGSVPIVQILERSGLSQWYEKTGFEIGAPKCSFCVGGAADIAGQGEVWLSLQNRNFPNRIGPGSFANIASAATVAASSFSMMVTDPRHLLDSINTEEFDRLRGARKDQQTSISYDDGPLEQSLIDSASKDNVIVSDTVSAAMQDPISSQGFTGSAIIFGDNVDTDAIISAKAMNASTDAQELGTYCFELARPAFYSEVQAGLNIVVAGYGFGCGSSREEAPHALLGAGVRAVIAKSFSFIFSRNCPNLAALAIVIADDGFYNGVVEGTPLIIDIGVRQVMRQDIGETFEFQLSSIEETLVSIGGISKAYLKDGKKVFRKLVESPAARNAKRSNDATSAMDW